ncbi:MAG: hypothetical protein RQ745_06345 [Longimicrobiales bacterium]|nr:hypothetical protein [Longimicrobiales bacterium]
MTSASKNEVGPGVPEALPRVVQRVLHAWGAERIDRLWLFPPLIRGRRESGLLVVGCFVEGSDDAGRRLLVTARYTAERTGRGLTLDVTIEEEGEAPEDRFPRVMQGVVVRSGLPLGEASQVTVGGSVEALGRWFAEVEEGYLDPALPPRAVQEELEMQEVDR